MNHYRTQPPVGYAPAAGQPTIVPLETYATFVTKGHVRADADAAFLQVSRFLFVELLRPMLHRIRFDADYYRRANPDLAAAEKVGQIASLHDHYLEHGYFENRLPCQVEVDAGWYTMSYPDVGEAIIAGSVASPTWHFETFGFREGRLPSQGWSFTDLLAP